MKAAVISMSDLLERAGGWRRVATIGVGALAVGVIVFVARSAASPGSELGDRAAYTSTDLRQRLNDRQALQGELDRTIGRLFDTVSAAGLANRNLGVQQAIEHHLKNKAEAIVAQ